MKKIKILLIILTILSVSTAGSAQHPLSRVISLEANRLPLGEVLKQISAQGHFQFSYNSSLIPADSIISLSVRQRTVKQTLDQLFAGRYEYRETGQYIIIQSPPAGQTWYLSGYVIDGQTGERVRDVSIYEEHQLVATLTNAQGFFRLKLRDKYPNAAISIRKSWYMDTSMILNAGYDQELTLSILPKSFDLDSIVVTPVEKNRLASLFLSSRQRIQSINLGKYFVDKPYQTSFTPGLGTHGRMSGQVVNKFSFNILGGYAAGVDGIELGGVFNIVKKDMQFAQIAGVFNIVGGEVSGVQIAGVFNNVLDTVSGVQIAGALNTIKGSLDGVQAGGLGNQVQGPVDGVQFAGLLNTTNGDLDGVQTSGLANYVHGPADGVQFAGLLNIAGGRFSGVQISGFGNHTAKNAKGVQLAGFGNIGAGEVKGAQIAGAFNYAKHMKGLQLAVVNIADTSSGYTVGLINIIRKGYHKITVSANEVTPLHGALKTGTRKLYSILMAGINPASGRNVFAYGFGLGTEITISRSLTFNPEISNRHVILGSWRDLNMLNRADLNFSLKAGRFISVFAGPSIVAYYESQQQFGSRNRSLVPANHQSFMLGNNDIYGWIGWNAGINFF